MTQGGRDYDRHVRLRIVIELFVHAYISQTKDELPRQAFMRHGNGITQIQFSALKL